MVLNKKDELVESQIIYMTPVEAYKSMETSMEGLSDIQVSQRLEKYGKNVITKKKQDSLFKKFIFCSF